MPYPALIMPPVTTPGRSPARLVGPCHWARQTHRYNRLYVVCSNNLGCCDGSSGPNTINPATSEPWGGAFPQPQVKDWVRSQKRLAEHLNIPRWAAVIGGSLGGMQALQWAVDFPDWVEHCIALRSAGLTAQNIAFNEIADTPFYRTRIGATAIIWRRETATRVALARMVGHLTYMSADGMSDRFGRELREEASRPAITVSGCFR